MSVQFTKTSQSQVQNPPMSITSQASVQNPPLTYTSQAAVGSVVVTNYPFSGGSLPFQAYGDRWQIQFSNNSNGSWARDEKWGIILTVPGQDYDIGSINFFSALLALTCCATFKNRVYIGAGPQFNFSDNSDPTGWEQQNPGAGDISYLSYFGSQDKVYALSQLQGRLVVLARRSVQIWTTDADPNNFALVQEMDNVGTAGSLSAQNRGDYDVIFLDDTGFRSLRAMEVTLNATLDDVGVPVDALVQADLQSVSAATCVTTVDPATKNYWGYLNGKIYVHARYPSSKISAWTQYLPSYEAATSITVAAAYTGTQIIQAVSQGVVYSWTPGAHEVSLVNGTQTLTAAGYFTAQGTSVTINGNTTNGSFTGALSLILTIPFTPQKFIISNGQVYVRTANQEMLVYGGSTNAVYDGCVLSVQTPWLDDKQPKLNKLGQGLDAAMSGYWHLKLGYDPTSGTLISAFDGVAPTGSEATDSTFDLERIGLSQKGTHFLIQAQTDATWHALATLSELQIHYNKGNTP